MPATVTVAALCFMEIWKRQQAELQYDWDVADFELEEVNSLGPTSPRYGQICYFIVSSSNVILHYIGPVLSEYLLM